MAELLTALTNKVNDAIPGYGWTAVKKDPDIAMPLMVQRIFV